MEVIRKDPEGLTKDGCRTWILELAKYKAIGVPVRRQKDDACSWPSEGCCAPEKGTPRSVMAAILDEKNQTTAPTCGW